MGGVSSLLPAQGHQHCENHLPSEHPNLIKMTTASPQIPKEQWAQVVEKKGGPVNYKKIPVPKPGPDEVLINIKFSGVCHTDLHAMMGDWPLETKMPSSAGTRAPVSSYPGASSS